MCSSSAHRLLIYFSKNTNYLFIFQNDLYETVSSWQKNITSYLQQSHLTEKETEKLLPLVMVKYTRGFKKYLSTNYFFLNPHINMFISYNSVFMYYKIKFSINLHCFNFFCRVLFKNCSILLLCQ